MKTSFRPEQGFTLIELMIAVGITAILATVAVTSYSSYVLRAHRAEAKSALLDLASLEERYLSTNNCYTATASALGYAALPLTIGSGYYQLQAPTWAATATSFCGSIATANTPASPPTFTVTAVPVPGSMQAKDTACASFTVTSTGSRTATMQGGADNTATCW
jgi:type IV pilus assembly protein PilE